MAVKAIAPRAWGSLATAPGSNEALYCAGGAAGFRIWRAARGWHWRISRNGRGFPYLMEFPEFARRPPGTEGQWKTALVNLARWESPRANPGRVTLPRPLSLSDFEPKFFIRRASAARPIRTNKAIANQSPRAQASSGTSLNSKGRLRVSNGLCKDSMMMQSTKPSNSDF